MAADRALRSGVLQAVVADGVCTDDQAELILDGKPLDLIEFTCASCNENFLVSKPASKWVKVCPWASHRNVCRTDGMPHTGASDT